MYRSATRQGRGNQGEDGTPGNEITKELDVCTLSSLQQKTIPVVGSVRPSSSLTILQSPYAQWTVQPTPLGQVGTCWLPSSSHPSCSSLLGAPWQKSVTSEAGAFVSKTRRAHDEQMTLKEMEKKKVRRERNRMAAARCRNRRRELIDRLQNETDQLEKDKAQLQEAIAGLEKLKDHLEFILEVHQPVCKMHNATSGSAKTSKPATMEHIKMEPSDFSLRGCLADESNSQPDKPKPEVSSPPLLLGACPASPALLLIPKSESLDTPIFISSPSLTPFSMSMVFTYPSSPLDCKASVQSHLSPALSSFLGPTHQTCGTTYRRASSSGDQWSDQSLHSPTLIG